MGTKNTNNAPDNNNSNTAPEKQPEAAEVVVGGGSAGSHMPKRRLIIIGVVILLLVIAGATTTALVINKKNTKTTDGTDVVVTPAQQEKALNEALTKAKTPQAKSAALDALADFSANKGDTKQAVVYAQRAVTEQKSAETYAVLAFNAEAAGDYVTAIAAYKSAASFFPKSANFDENTDYNYYTGKAMALEAKKK